MVTSTARRRFSRELPHLVDGLAFATQGPILVHGYEPPAGGKWMEDFIPGILTALDRNTGEPLWRSVCEVGYGRGFGAGLIDDRRAVVLGPGVGGHRAIRVALASGELETVGDIPAFDEAVVGADLCLCISAGRLFAVDSETLDVAWELPCPEGQRFHSVRRAGNRALALFSKTETGGHGILSVDVGSGEDELMLVAPVQPEIHDVAVSDDVVVLATSQLETLLPPDSAAELAMELGEEESEQDALSVVALRVESDPGDAPLWYRVLASEQADVPEEVALRSDSGKLYLEKGAYLEVIDGLTGRSLGEWTVPGLDEMVAWQVAEGAGLLAEETRISLFELPA